MNRIISFGEALIDFSPAVQAQDDAPRLFAQHAGGAPANVAVAVARLGGSAEFIGMLGSDMFGDFLLRSLRDAGVGTRYVQRTEQAPTALAFVALDAQGERSFSFYRPPAADLLFRDTDLPDSAFQDAGFFHVCSNSMTEAAIAQTTFSTMQRARDAGVLLSFDMNLRPALWPRDSDPMPRLWRALRLADIVKLSREEFDVLAGSGGGEAGVLRHLSQAKCRLLVITDGARPLRWYTSVSGGTLDSFSVTTVDSTAAGDAFTGGLLFAMATLGIDRESLTAFTADADALYRVLRFASACGAWAATQPGAFSAMPTRDDVERLIAGAVVGAGLAPARF
jgi:fructokinase